MRLARLRPVLVLALALAGGACHSAVVYVKKDAPGPGHDGKSWVTAFTTVPAALSAAASGSEVWVAAAGEYTGQTTLKAGVALYGGFSGAETARAQRDPRRNVTELVAFPFPGPVVTVPSGAGTTTVIDGFTIRGGTSGTQGTYVVGGAGIFCKGASPTISNNLITGNGDYGTDGGAGILLDNSYAVVKGNTITRNRARLNGAGIYCSGGAPTISGNTITANDFLPLSYLVPRGHGAGIFCSGSNAAITSNVISGNVAGDWGGGILLVGGGSEVRDNVIAANTARYGSAIACQGGASTRVANNTIVANNGPNGAVWNNVSAAVHANNIIAFNTTGFVAVLSANGSTATPTLRNNCVYGNTAYNYSGLAADPTGTGGNIAKDPLLANWAAGALHIQPSSPCRDKGLNAYAPSAIDIDGQPRIQDTTVDIGADESNGVAWPSATPVVRVRPDGNDAADGATWQTAKRTVQAAVNALAPGGEVWVAAGVYAELVTVGPFVALYGGFSGTETDRLTRNPTANPTVLDGGQRAPVVTFFGTGSTGVLDGFTVRNGRRLSEASGVWLYGASARIAGNTLSHNLSDNYPGGALYCVVFSSATITGNAITDNLTGVTCIGGSDATVTDNLITGNLASGVLAREAAPTIARNHITGNGMGGVWCEYDPSEVAPMAGQPLIAGNTIIGNGAITPGGGGISIGDCSPTVVNNTIAANMGAGLLLWGDARPLVANNIIALGRYGAYKDAGAQPVLRSNCVYGNTDGNFQGFPAEPVGNITQDPRLALLPFGNAHIQPGSPCRDAGDVAVPGIPTTDMDGQPRTIGPRLDIGADESDGITWPATQPVLRVSPAGNDAGDGATWATAKRSIQAAADALAHGGGDVWVAAGLYRERVALRPFVRLYGGFQGTEAVASQRDWHANASVIDAEGLDRALTLCGGYIWHRVDGFTIRNGYAGRIGDGGAGMLCYGSDAVIVNNLFTNNHADNEGGGIRSYASSTLIQYNVFRDNYAADGSAISGGARVVDNLIAGNQTAGYNVAAVSGSLQLVANNTIVGNNSRGLEMYGGTAVNNIIALNGGGFYGTPASFRDNDLYGNTRFGDYTSGTADLTGTDGNIRADPRFVDASAWNYRLQAGSPGIDAGDDSLVLPGDTDLDGRPRRQSARVDMGAFEYRPPFRVEDAAVALRIAAGMTVGSPDLLSRLNAVDTGRSRSTVDIADAIRIARAAAGLEL